MAMRCSAMSYAKMCAHVSWQGPLKLQWKNAKERGDLARSCYAKMPISKIFVVAATGLREGFQVPGACACLRELPIQSGVNFWRNQFSRFEPYDVSSRVDVLILLRPLANLQEASSLRAASNSASSLSADFSCLCLCPWQRLEGKGSKSRKHLHFSFLRLFCDSRFEVTRHLCLLIGVLLLSLYCFLRLGKRL